MFGASTEHYKQFGREKCCCDRFQPQPWHQNNSEEKGKNYQFANTNEHFQVINFNKLFSHTKNSIFLKDKFTVQGQVKMTLPNSP